MSFNLRNDDFGRNFYLETESGLTLIPYKTGEYTAEGIAFKVNETEANGILCIEIEAKAEGELKVKRFGFRLGVDTYMDKYPDWNEKYFPTALRCESKSFWSVFCSPLGKLVSVVAPYGVVSWKNEYNKLPSGDVGHRIYTSSVEFVNTLPQPSRHPESPKAIGKKPIRALLYYYCPEDVEDAYKFIKFYGGVSIPRVNKFTLELHERLIVNGQAYSGNLKSGLNVIKLPDSAELTVYVRKDWFYYLDQARKSAEACQQHPGTHCESWYGYFSRVEYAKLVADPDYTASLCEEFDGIFLLQTELSNGMRRMRAETLPNRLQNSSSMISLLADFYELTEDEKYLEWAYGLADWLMQLQVEDGSYRNRNTHYTCVIYPAKSMLELALAEKSAGKDEAYKLHFDSAVRAIENLAVLLDNIGTEGEMTFEDGMISCESLQLGFLATILPEGKDKQRFAAAAKQVLKKHLCLEQQFIPDCRTRGCTLRYWEARYDLNFFQNALNCPHGWTSWKTYATYYLYILTGELGYLKDTMDTMGASVQCVDENGVLHWGYIADPCVEGLNLKKGCTPATVAFENTVLGEQYLPMLSSWYRQDPERMILQYQDSATDPARWEELYGGTCDNDVHEHFKCLAETVLGKVFIHQTAYGDVTYNCRLTADGYVADERFTHELVVYSEADRSVKLNGKEYSVQKGLSFIKL